MIRAAVLLLALTGCAAPRSPVASRVVLSGGMTWYGPSCAVASARARWYCDPTWRVADNIPALGYGR